MLPEYSVHLQFTESGSAEMICSTIKYFPPFASVTSFELDALCCAVYCTITEDPNTNTVSPLSPVWTPVCGGVWVGVVCVCGGVGWDACILVVCV